MTNLRGYVAQEVDSRYTPFLFPFEKFIYQDCSFAYGIFVAIFGKFLSSEAKKHMIPTENEPGKFGDSTSISTMEQMRVICNTLECPDAKSSVEAAFTISCVVFDSCGANFLITGFKKIFRD